MSSTGWSRRAASSWAPWFHRWGPVRFAPTRTYPLAVRGRKPFLTAFPGAVASRGVRRLARALVRERHPPARNRGAGFFRALAARWALSLVASG